MNNDNLRKALEANRFYYARMYEAMRPEHEKIRIEQKQILPRFYHEAAEMELRMQAMEAEFGHKYNHNHDDLGRFSEAYGVSPRKVERVRQRLVEEGFEAAFHRKSGYQTRPPKVTGKVEAHLVALCCGTPPEGRSRWTLKLLGDRLVEMEIVESISHESVRQALKKTNSNPGARSSGAFRPKEAPPSSARWRKS